MKLLAPGVRFSSDGVVCAGGVFGAVGAAGSGAGVAGSVGAMGAAGSSGAGVVVWASALPPKAITVAMQSEASFIGISSDVGVSTGQAEPGDGNRPATLEKGGDGVCDISAPAVQRSVAAIVPKPFVEPPARAARPRRPASKSARKGRATEPFRI
ncbi:hypothetical protein CJ014_22165 [Pleomorphomonas carboxyditropha]|uniref:Uncharacterized protein n=1 Tax=Pleomorphomonas carboxyditropha TaxID=2023338 RepID=A0A2G9WQL1_9HYPH|nr:hypothetical protein CJ014_22165 [Pleomorphomonas carboxyditropha]